MTSFALGLIFAPAPIGNPIPTLKRNAWSLVRSTMQSQTQS
jgi:hypothetical protein